MTIFVALRARLARAHGLGAILRSVSSKQEMEGVFADITEDGRLLVETEQDGAVTVSAGDVYFGAGMDMTTDNNLGFCAFGRHG